MTMTIHQSLYMFCWITKLNIAKYEIYLFSKKILLVRYVYRDNCYLTPDLSRSSLISSEMNNVFWLKCLFYISKRLPISVDGSSFTALTGLIFQRHFRFLVLGQRIYVCNKKPHDGFLPERSILEHPSTELTKDQVKVFPSAIPGNLC